LLLTLEALPTFGPQPLNEPLGTSAITRDKEMVGFDSSASATGFNGVVTGFPFDVKRKRAFHR
jgi:hypothetical protein